MKKTALFVLALLMWQFSSAKVFTQDQARQLAADFFSTATLQTKASPVSSDEVTLICTFPDATTKAGSSDPSMYIFERKSGGFAIVSGNDAVRPILGYSLDGHFDPGDMPDNLRTLLQWYSDIIAYADAHQWDADVSWASANAPDPNQAVQLQTALWHQNSPFNDLVADINGKRPPIGCVATSIAIIMQYHKWPRRGTGTLPSYDYTMKGVTYHVDGFALGHEYDWDKMPSDVSHCTKEEAAQMSRLLYDVAVMCEMNFYPGGSGASGISALTLPEYFNYDKSVRFHRRKDYSTVAFEQFVIDEIDSSRPVCFSAASKGGAHNFVIDGYNGRYFSANFGWGGTSNGYYTLSPVEGHEEDLIAFYRDQDVICRIMPDQGGDAQPVVFAGGSVDLPRDFMLNEPFYLSNIVSNASPGSFRLDFGYVLYDRNGGVKEVISQERSAEVSSPNFTTLSRIECKITKSLADGDRILLAIKDPISGTWTPVAQPRSAMIVFTERPLSELIEVGYAENPKEPDTQNPQKKRDVFIHSYKDIIWEFQNEDGEWIFSNSRGSGYWSPYDVSKADYMFDEEDGQCDKLVCEFWITSGTYRLHVYNPTNGEKMDIILEI